MLLNLYRKHLTIGLFSVSSTLNGIIGIIIGPLILKKVGLSEFGYLGLAHSTILFFSAIIDFGLTAHLINTTSKNNKDKTQQISNCIFLKLALAILTCGLFFCYYQWFPHPDTSKQLLLILLIGILISPLQIEWYFLGRQNYNAIILARFLSIMIYTSFIITWYYNLQSILWVPMGSVLGQTCSSIYLILKVRLISKINRLVKFQWKSTCQIMLKTLPVALVSFLTPFYLGSGILLVERTGYSADIIGLYGIPQKVIIGWLSLIGPLVFYFLPKLSLEVKFERKLLIKIASVAFIFFYVTGCGIIYIYINISGAENLSLEKLFKLYTILCTGLFFTTLRIPYVSLLLNSEEYLKYFLVHLIAIVPVAYIFLNPVHIPVFYLAALACLPDFILTLYLVLDEKFRSKK